MNKIFEKRFNILQDLLKEYEDELKNISDEEANQKPGSGGWSIAEVVYHISIAEKGIIQYIQKKLIDPAESKKAGLKSFYKAALLRYALRSSRKFRAPKVLDEPKGPYEKDQLLKDWQATRLQLEELYKKVPDEYIRHQLFRHPVVGKINLKQTLGFMADHMQRHLDQIRVIKVILRQPTG